MYGTTAPAFTIGPAFSLVSADKLLAVVVWLIFAVWIIYTVIAAYHWLRYSHRSSLAIPALLTHAVVSLGFALFAVSGLA